jgi:hypothetical protein
MYKGDIYKTRNLRNKSMMQMYPDSADLHRAQDSIQQRLDNFEKKLWVPDREQVIAAKSKTKATVDENTSADESLEAAVAEAVEPEKTTRTTKRSTARSSKKSSAKTSTKVKTQKASTSSSATKSVRRRK